MAELFHNFGVEWKLLLAQAVNFFVLLIVLRKFLYKPILKMLVERREKIVKGLESAKEAEEKLKNIDIMRDSVLVEAHKKELGIVRRAEEQARAKEKEILKEAHRKAEEVVKDAKKLAQEEEAKSFEEIYKESAALVKSALVKVFEKSPEAFEDKLIEDSLQELRSLKSFYDKV